MNLDSFDEIFPVLLSKKKSPWCPTHHTNLSVQWTQHSAQLIPGSSSLVNSTFNRIALHRVSCDNQIVFSIGLDVLRELPCAYTCFRYSGTHSSMLMSKWGDTL